MTSFPRRLKRRADDAPLAPLRTSLSIFVAIAILTAVVTTVAVRAEHDEERLTVERDAGATVSAIESRLIGYTEAMRSLQALIQTDPSLSHRRFHRFARSLQVQARFPGIRGLSYAPRVANREKAEFVAETRASIEQSGEEYPEFVIAPAGHRPIYSPVTFIEPVFGNEAAVGFDLFSEKSRRATLRRTQETGRLAATAPIVLVQETEERLAFLMALAVRDTGVPLTSVEAGRVVGAVTAVFDADDLFNGISPRSGGSSVTIYDRGLVSAAPADPELLFTNAGSDAPQPGANSRGEMTTEIEVGGRRWDVVYAETGAAGGIGLGPWLLAVGGLLIAALIASLAYTLSSSRSRALSLARRMTSDLERSQQRLQQSNDALEQRARALERSNAELAEFATIASHDLQEPLRKVQMLSSRLEVREAERFSPDGQDQMAAISDAAARMRELIEDLLSFSRVSTQGQPFVAVDLNEIVANVVKDLEGAIAETGARVEVGELPTATGDPAQIRQLLQNLVSNGLKFHREGSEHTVEIAGCNSDGEVELTVTDNGIGFDPKYSERIFRVFERLHNKEAYRGTGIGLALCRKITDRHGGTISAEGAPGEGATFTVRLPAEPGDKAQV